MGKDAVTIRAEYHTRLGRMARELAQELYPDGLPRGTKFSELEAIAGVLGDEMARHLIALHVQEQADDWPEDELGECPACGGVARKAPGEPRVLTTTRGDVAWKERVAHCPGCRRAFSPQDHALGLDRCSFSPRVQQKIVHAGVNSPSYPQASRDLAELSDLKVGPKPVERLVRKIGRERIDPRDAAVAAHQRLPLMAQGIVADPKRSTPSVAMASVDGGRMQIRSDASRPKPESLWRESKVVVLETYLSEVHPADPDPDVPRCFLDLKRTKEMVRGLGHDLPIGLEFGAENQGRGQDVASKTQPDRRARPSVWSGASWPAEGVPRSSARSCIRQPGSGTSSGPCARRSWKAACR